MKKNFTEQELTGLHMLFQFLEYLQKQNIYTSGGDMEIPGVLNAIKQILEL